MTVWHVRPADPARAETLAALLDLHPTTAQLLLHRGVTDGSAARRFFHVGLEALRDPLELPDLARGVSRLRQAIRRREPLLIFGDSDVDGLTASMILYEALGELGARVSARSANRVVDGYGVPEAVVQQMCRSSIALVVLVDCGTNQAEAVRRLAVRGIETIVIDHHVPSAAPAEPYALINPHCAAADGFRELSSAGLAFKVVQALFDGEAPERLAAHLDLAALGLLADYSPLLGESRIIVSAGLERVVQSHRPGLRRLCEATRTRAPNPDQILRRLVPRLNACGRLGDPAAVWHLLHSDAHPELEAWMAQTEAAHTTTKRLYRRILAEAEEQVRRLHFKDQFVMIVSRTGWPKGLMGPVASYLVERYGRPAIAIAMDEHRGTGSGRAGTRFNLLEVLQACQETLVRFGGHAQACGLTIDRTQLERFRLLINERARSVVGRQGLLQTRTVDLELSLRHVQPRWVEEAERFVPFGHGNPRPTMVLRRLTIELRSPRRAVLSDGVIRMAGKGHWPAQASGERYDVVASPAVEGNEVVLTVSGVRVWQPEAPAPSERSALSPPVQTSGMPCKPESA